MPKVLVFTMVDKVGKKNKFIDGDDLASSVKNSIKRMYGIQKENFHRHSIYGSEAMNGDELYIEVVSNDEDACGRVAKSIQKSNIRYRSDLDEWVEKKKLNIIDTTATIGMYDAYLIEII